LKQRIFYLTQVAFCVGQEAENEFIEYATPWNIAFRILGR